MKSLLSYITPLVCLPGVWCLSLPAANAQTVANAGFETPSLGSGSYQLDPAGASWTFSGASGIGANGCAYTSANPNAPEGAQVAILQTTGSFSQVVSVSAGSFYVRFRAAQRNWGNSQEDFQVLLDGSVLGTFQPADTTYDAWATAGVTLARGNHTLEFKGLDTVGGDNTALIDQVGIYAVNTPANGGFEAPAVGSGSYQLDPTAGWWSFYGNSGVSANGSGYTSGNPSAPDGTQIAVVEETGYLNQPVTLAAGSYAITFKAAQRASYGPNAEDFEVLVDGSGVGTFTPAGTSYASATTNSFSVSAGAHTVEFRGLDTVTGDNTAFVDSVAIASASAPPTGPATGYYRLTPASKATDAVDIWGMANASGATVDMWPWNAGPNQTWYVERGIDGSYKIYAYSARNSLQMLDYGGSTSNGQAVVTQEDKAVDGVSDLSQRWWFKSVSNGKYRIIPYNAGLLGTATLEIKGGTAAADGAALDLLAYAGTANQQFQMTSIATPAVLANAKKGLPAASSNVGNANMVAAAGKMNCTWIYNWSITPPSNIPAGIEFVPQVWGWYSASPDTNVTNEVLAANPSAHYVLGYNEPDMDFADGGSQMSLSDGLQGFQYISALKAYGYTIGGPSCAVDSGTWMQSFLSQAVAAPYNYNLDFIGFHNYVGDSTGAAAADDILGFLDYVHSLYPSYPIWVTEAGASGLSNTREGLTYVRLLCQGLQSRSYVQRYSLFSSQLPAASGFGASAFVNTDGTLTDAGALYGRM